jgi:phospholipid-binding lipoprotein MlaA
MGSTPLAAQEENQDPWEGFNRKVFAFNDSVDGAVLKPLAKGYRAITPDPVEQSVGNVFSNLAEVKNVLNSVLQGKPKEALHDSGRFLVNSTLGILGLFDVAETFGLEQSDGEDFGQTLAVWGVSEGPYLVLPFFGPSSVRGLAGMPVDSLTDLVNQIDDVPTRNSLMALELLDLRASLLDVEGLASGDKYLFFREAYLQRREFLVNDGVVEDDFFDDFEDEDY